MAFSSGAKKGLGMILIVAAVGGGGYFFMKTPPKQAATYQAPITQPAHQSPAERELEKIADPKAELKIVESTPEAIPTPVKKKVVKVAPKPRAHAASHGSGGSPSPVHNGVSDDKALKDLAGQDHM
jgi:hypothetical protein